jgi:hypothetical protein
MKIQPFLSMICASAVASTAATAQNGPQLTPLATGLNNPRGLAFAPNGTLYVAEAGIGAGDGNGGFGVGLGFTASIGEIRGVNSGHPTWRRIVTGLASVGDTENGFPEALGPSGVSVHGNGGIYVTIGESALGIGADMPDLPARAAAQLGHVLKMTPSGQWKAVADVGDFDYQWTGENKDQPWAPDQFPDANPYGLLALPGKQFVADAGANTLNEVSANGSVRLVAYFPNPVLPLPGGGQATISDAVPTCVAQGPDGDLYVGVLAFGANFARFSPTAPPNWPSLPPQSKIYRIKLGTSKFFLDETDVWASGFNPIVALQFGKGALYVTEYVTEESHFQTGDVVRVQLNGDGSAGPRTAIGVGALNQPNGLALDSNGAIYVSNFSISSGGGQVVRVNY